MINAVGVRTKKYTQELAIIQFEYISFSERVCVLLVETNFGWTAEVNTSECPLYVSRIIRSLAMGFAFGTRMEAFRSVERIVEYRLNND